MTDKPIVSENINKKDLEIILEVNKKAVEIETAMVDQNEEIIALLTENKEKQEQFEKSLEKIVKQNDEIDKDLFKIQVLFLTGLLSLVVQIIQIFKR